MDAGAPQQQGQPDSLPPQTELVFGLVGAVGINLTAIFNELRAQLSEYEYIAHDIHLTDQLAELNWDQELLKGPYDERVWSYMTAGNELRKEWQHPDAFGLLAINAVNKMRAEQTGDPEVPSDRTAYVLRSLKRSEEIELLRDVYGSRFILISAYAPEGARSKHLDDAIRKSRVKPYKKERKYSTEDLIKRDYNEPGEYGQDVISTFHRGDFFIDATAALDTQLKRTLEVLFGHPNRTPTKDEFGMFQAVAASRRSAELSRQVGASICARDGSVIAVGTNEVPAPSGGLYWEGDKGDAREFTKGRNTSEGRKEHIATLIAKELDDRKWLAPGIGQEQVKEKIKETPIGDLIEFVRAVHAEMAALMDAARRGTPVSDTVLFVTTFPCHHCARHIVAAGIMRVVYIDPYPKSLVKELHSDSIAVDPEGKAGDDTESEEGADRRLVTFEPFVGVGPRRYMELFEMPVRQEADGTVREFDPKTALPRIAELEPDTFHVGTLPYIRREQHALALLEEIQSLTGPKLEGL